MNPVVESEYNFLIQQAEKEGLPDRAKALRVGLARAKRRAAEASKSEA